MHGIGVRTSFPRGPPEERQRQLPRLLGRERDPVSATRCCRGGVSASLEPQRASARPTNWTRTVLVVPWNLPLGSQHPGYCLKLPLPDTGATTTGKQAAKSNRELSYAYVGAAYSGLVAEKPVTGSSAGVDTLAVLPTKKGHPRRVKNEGT